MKPWPKKRRIFRAFDARGTLLSSTWTSSPVTYIAECAMYQQMLQQGRYATVQITSNDPQEPAHDLSPRGAPPHEP